MRTTKSRMCTNASRKGSDPFCRDRQRAPHRLQLRERPDLFLRSLERLPDRSSGIARSLCSARRCRRAWLSVCRAPPGACRAMPSGNSPSSPLPGGRRNRRSAGCSTSRGRFRRASDAARTRIPRDSDTCDRRPAAPPADISSAARATSSTTRRSCRTPRDSPDRQGIPAPGGCRRPSDREWCSCIRRC